jgi:nitroreductase
MTDAIQLLKTRRSISAPFLKEPAPDDTQLDEILTVASRVPDHGKLVPWRFIVFRGDAGRQASELLARLYAGKNPDTPPARIEEEEKRLARAPLVVAVVSRAAPHPKIPEVEQLLSAGNAAMSIVLASHALGYAAQWTTGWIAYDADAGRILGLQPGETFVGFVHIGTAMVPPVDRPRPELGEIVSTWQPPA